MNSSFNSHLIDAYRWSTFGLRQFNLHLARKSGTVPVMILFYHRVSNESPNPWSISDAGFEEQITWMQQNFDMVDLAECQKRMRDGNNTRPTVSITFDDGYADNCNFALPMLIERGIPVTYFVTHHTVNGQPFAHDVERGQPLAPNTNESLRALSGAGVEIGGHTRNHPDLGKIHDQEQLFDEVITASKEMEELIEQKIRYFAFPFGKFENLNPVVFKMLKDEGFDGVCSAYGGLNEIGADPFFLQRIHGDPMLARIKNWLSGDPRLKSVEKYDWETRLENPIDSEQPTED